MEPSRWRRWPQVFNRWRYNLYAPVYDRLAQAFAARRRRSIALLNPQPEERILLVAAGTGLDLDFMVRCRHLVAIDISDGMLARLRAHAATLGMEVDARVMDAQALEFADASFDAVVLHLALAVVPDPRACIREVERVLKPGGRVAVFDKFLHDDQRPSLLRSAGNLLSRVIATDINRRLADILAGCRLRKVHDEDAGLGGFFRIAILRK
ncbi:class I SAM-dependent methyltransferase [Chromobacterium sp.]|uniref:class I SAM-dependent methyltransferase n=1 Tax=Chromobacterium sp. TaxID=306190 RepID=UPI0035B0849F